MNEQAQRIAIAEACGWTRREGPSTIWYYYPPGTFPKFATPIYDLPDYLHDLNAMHEAEKVMSVRHYWEYADLRLKEAVWKNGPPGIAYQLATATQRAEAFLRTLGLWEEGE